MARGRLTITAFDVDVRANAQAVLVEHRCGRPGNMQGMRRGCEEAVCFWNCDQRRGWSRVLPAVFAMQRTISTTKTTAQAREMPFDTANDVSTNMKQLRPCEPPRPASASSTRPAETPRCCAMAAVLAHACALVWAVNLARSRFRLPTAVGCQASISFSSSCVDLSARWFSGEFKHNIVALENDTRTGSKGDKSSYL